MRALVLAAALGLLAAACGGGDESAPGTEAPRATGPAATAPAATAPAATEPTADDPLAGETLDGEPLSLADFRGRTVFVNVWSSW